MSDDRPCWEKFTSKEWACALVGLTPGGSEFLTPAECVAHLRDRFNYPRQIIDLRKRVAELETELKILKSKKTPTNS